MGREWWKNFLFAPFFVEADPSFFFFNDPFISCASTYFPSNPPIPPILQPHLRTPSCLPRPRPSLQHRPRLGINGIQCVQRPIFPNPERRSSTSRVVTAKRKIKAQAHGQDWDDEPPEVRTDEEEPCGWGNAGRCDVRGGGGRYAEIRCRESLSAKLSQGFDRKASELHVGQGSYAFDMLVSRFASASFRACNPAMPFGATAYSLSAIARAVSLVAVLTFGSWGTPPA